MYSSRAGHTWRSPTFGALFAPARRALTSAARDLALSSVRPLRPRGVTSRMSLCALAGGATDFSWGAAPAVGTAASPRAIAVADPATRAVHARVLRMRVSSEGGGPPHGRTVRRPRDAWQ